MTVSDSLWPVEDGEAPGLPTLEDPETTSALAHRKRRPRGQAVVQFVRMFQLNGISSLPDRSRGCCENGLIVLYPANREFFLPKDTHDRIGVGHGTCLARFIVDLGAHPYGEGVPAKRGTGPR